MTFYVQVFDSTVAAIQELSWQASLQCHHFQRSHPHYLLTLVLQWHDLRHKSVINVKGNEGTCDQADSQAHERVDGDKVECGQRRGTSGLAGLLLGSRLPRLLTVQAVDDCQLGQVTEEAIRQIVTLRMHEQAD